MISENAKSPNRGSAADHLANERTFLAWIRTSIGIMGLGFALLKLMAAAIFFASLLLIAYLLETA